MNKKIIGLIILALVGQYYYVEYKNKEIGENQND